MSEGRPPSPAFVVVVALAAWWVALCVPASAQVGLTPRVIPGLQEWVPATGTWIWTTNARIVATDGDLAQVASTLADDLDALSGHRPSTATSALAGDIVLSLEPGDLPEHGYELRVRPDGVTIVADTTTGVFHGTRSLLQLIVHNSAVPAGTARDWPRYPDRGFMVDAGRKHVSAEWIEQHIKELAWLKMNVLHYHLSDNPGFRVALDSHPEVVSVEHLTKAEVAHLVEVAQRYHVEIVPEVDLPGHAEFLLAEHPAFQLRDATGTPNPQALDITNDDARKFAREIIEEVLEMFPGRWYHGGGDEFIHPGNQVLLPAEPAYPTYPALLTYAQDKYGPTAVHKDAYLDFLNWMNEVARDNGRTLRLWADGMHGGSAVTLDTDIVAEWWQFQSATASPNDLVDAGMQVLNAGWMPGYYSVASYSELSGQRNWPEFWDGWEVHEFWGIDQILTGGSVPPRETLPPDSTANRGAKAHLWHDEPDLETLEQSTVGVCPMLRLIADKAWGAPSSDTWDEFSAVIETAGRAPGFSIVDDPSCPISQASVVAAAQDRDAAVDAPAPLPVTGGGLGIGAVVLAAASRRRMR